MNKRNNNNNSSFPKTARRILLFVFAAIIVIETAVILNWGGWLNSDMLFGRSSMRPRLSPGLQRQIDEYLEPFKKNGISLSQIVEAAKHRECIRIKIVSQQVYFDCASKACSGFHARAVGSMLYNLTRSHRVPDVEFVVNLMDEPIVRPEPKNPHEKCVWTPFEESGLEQDDFSGHFPRHPDLIFDTLLPVFSVTTAPLLGYKDILFPDFTYFNWKEQFQIIDKMNRRHGQYSLSDRSSVCIWRGGATGSKEGTFSFVGSLRDRFVRKANQEGFSGQIDAGITDFPYWWVDGNMEEHHKDYYRFVTKKKMSLSFQFDQYKCLIDLDGNAGSGRLKQLLFADVVVVKAKTPFRDLMSLDLVSWKHFIPLCRDFENTEWVMKWMKKNPKKVEEIAKESTVLMKKYFTMEKVIAYLQVLLQEYSKLLNFDVKKEFESVRNELDLVREREDKKIGVPQVQIGRHYPND